MSIYLELTEAFNRDGKLRAIICSGQAVVLHRLAIMSKDGDWVIREDRESLDHLLSTLKAYGATYRFGAPLDLRWLKHGWSSHFEFQREGIRVRTDFFTRPPRLSTMELAELWKEQEMRRPPFLGARDLVKVKMTQREKDYPVIGELARLLPDVGDQFRFSRSAHDLFQLVDASPALAAGLVEERPLLRHALKESRDLEGLEVALDAERRTLMKADAARLAAFEAAAAPWRAEWTSTKRLIENLSLPEAHAIFTERAEQWLPTHPTV